jgi:hypothetical protein
MTLSRGVKARPFSTEMMPRLFGIQSLLTTDKVAARLRLTPATVGAVRGKDQLGNACGAGSARLTLPERSRSSAISNKMANVHSGKAGRWESSQKDRLTVTM